MKIKLSKINFNGKETVSKYARETYGHTTQVSRRTNQMITN